MAMLPLLPQFRLDRASSDRTLASSCDPGSARRHAGAGKPLRPVAHNSRADVTSTGSESQVRCFFSLAHKKCNPYGSDFHMQARLGFKRPNKAAQVRLRPLEHVPTQLATLEGGGSLSDSQFLPVPSHQQQSPSPSYRRRQRPGKNKRGEHSLSPLPPPPAARDQSGQPPRSAATCVLSRPVTALLPEEGNTTWTTFEGMTRDTIGAVFEEALREEEPETAEPQVPLMEAAVAAAASAAEKEQASAGAVASSFFADATEAPADSSAAEHPGVRAPPPDLPAPDVLVTMPSPKTPLLKSAASTAIAELAIDVEIQDLTHRLVTQAYKNAPRYSEVAVAPSGMVQCAPLLNSAPSIASAELAIDVEIQDLTHRLVAQAYKNAPRYSEVAIAPSGASAELALDVEIQDLTHRLVTQAYKNAPRNSE